MMMLMLDANNIDGQSLRKRANNLFKSLKLFHLQFFITCNLLDDKIPHTFDKGRVDVK